MNDFAASGLTAGSKIVFADSSAQCTADATTVQIEQGDCLASSHSLNPSADFHRLTEFVASAESEELLLTQRLPDAAARRIRLDRTEEGRD